MKTFDFTDTSITLGEVEQWNTNAFATELIKDGKVVGYDYAHFTGNFYALTTSIKKPLPELPEKLHNDISIVDGEDEGYLEAYCYEVKDFIKLLTYLKK